MLKAVAQAGHQVGEAKFVRAVAIMRERLRQLGIRATVTHPSGSQLLVIDLLDAKSANGLPAAVTDPGVLEFYDLEADLVRPSIDAKGFPVASRKPLIARPPTVVVTCGPPAIACPGTAASPSTTYYYLFKHDPALTDADLKLGATRADIDPVSGAAIVLMEFTAKGAKAFHVITRREAQRGRLRTRLTGQLAFQHFAIVLDHHVESYPAIDFLSYPDGIAGTSAQITGIDSLAKAKALAAVLQTGALPVRFVRIR